MTQSQGTASTFVDIMRAHAERRPSAAALTFIADRQRTEETVSYEQLDRHARAIAALLQARGLQGERALLLHPQGIEYLAAFLGCLYAGVIAVPIYPPDSNKPVARIDAIAANAQASIALVNQAAASSLQAAFDTTPRLHELEVVASDAIADELARDWRPPAIDGQTIAFLQYTSGSTSTPKGVVLTHHNLIQNQHMLKAAFGHSEQSCIVCWAPLYHDMGLIAHALQALFLGVRCVLMSPFLFIRRPETWLQAIAAYGGTSSGAPNFAFDLCVRQVTPAQMAGVDLSSWTLAFNGAEPVRAETLERFADHFARYGFRREALFPCYGLAEATVLATGGVKGTLPRLYVASASALERHEASPDARPGEEQRVVVSCGYATINSRITIVDSQTRLPCPDGRVGEVWIAGPHVGQGYWQQPELSREVFQAHTADGSAGPCLRTGDLGFMRAGEVFITGRIKDLIIIDGRNHYPHDIEHTVEGSHQLISPRNVIAFAVDADGAERLVVVARLNHKLLEGHRPAADQLEEAIKAVKRAVAQEHDIRPWRVVLTNGAIPKTSSGKLQRQTCRMNFLQGMYDAIPA